MNALSDLGWHVIVTAKPTPPGRPDGRSTDDISRGFPPLPFSDPTRTLEHDLVEGRARGIPDCCIVEFVADCLAGRFPAQLRPPIFVDGKEYVPCGRCLKWWNADDERPAA